LLFIATILLSGLLVFTNLSEFIRIGLMKQTGGYPFGGEGPTPWYYKTPQLYAIINLIFGLFFFCSFSISLWAFIRHKKEALLLTFITTLAIALIQFINGLSA
jgi:hypothetical protein